MKIIHLDGFNEEERLGYKTTIANNILTAMRTLIHQANKYNYHLSTGNEVYTTTLCTSLHYIHYFITVFYSFCSLFIVHCSLFIVHCSLFIVHCSLFIVHCSLFIVHCSSFIVHHSLLLILFITVVMIIQMLTEYV